MIQPIKVKNITFGEGAPKICAPIVSATQEKILEESASLQHFPIDLVEWRVDFFEDVFQTDKVLSTLKLLHECIPAIPLIFTFRTKAEGGEKSISTDDYFSLALNAAKSGFADFIDIEYLLLQDTEQLQSYIKQLQSYDVKIILSNHDFHKTPAKEEIIKRLCHMQELNCDIPKIAVMPSSPYDVLTLLDATYTFYEKYSTKPFITMSMSSTGCISRICGEIFGSCITFGSVGQASAPGQIPVIQLKEMLPLFSK